MMMKPTLILGVAILVTFAAQGDTLAIDDQSDNSTCPPHCDFCTGEDYLCRYHPRQDYNCPSRCEYCLGGECYRNFVQIPGWLIASIVVAALVIFVLFPCAICHCRRQDCYHHCGYNHPEVMHIQGRAPPGYQQLTSLP
ncbi:Mucin-1 [Folsomia candida]|uniref:Mucin-1 n=1 Tax=Folsomia candida TaxID=158441 RepID=A0A226D0R5_FOLCA|nr:Mucin-1 [Folsomia candida]